MKKIVLIGAGALGSHFALFARNIPAALTVVDFDRIESKNVTSQFCGKTSSGKNKAAALPQTMAFLFGTKVTGVPHRLSPDNDDAILKGADLVVDCVDNAATRRLIQAYAVRTGTPTLHGALAAGGQYGRVVWSEHFQIDSEDGAGAATCEDGEFLPFIGLVSAYLAQAAQRFIKDGKKIGFEVSPAGTIFT